ncbi:MAG: hypothetical protein O6942_02400 [Bacteroidetes bacterium]|nr:hypothetical protein [Bacteroidota bacterium]
MKLYDRGDFLKAASFSTAAVCSGCAEQLVVASSDKKKTTESVQTTQPSPEGFFSLGKRENRWILLTPDRKPFFSVGLNHIDSSPLRYPENLSRWEQKYENDTIKWIRESVAPNLKSWGFNSVGWVQQVSIGQHARTPSFTLEEYRALDLPYCHLRQPISMMNPT